MTGDEQGLYKPWEVGRGLWGVFRLMAGAGVLATLHLHKEGFQVFAGHVQMRREEV